MYSFKLFARDPWIGFPLVAASALNAVAWWYTARHLLPATETFFLHYTVVFGVDWVERSSYVLLIPLSGTVLVAVNLGLAWWLYRDERLLARLLPLFTCLLQAGMLVTLRLLFQLNP